MEKFPSSARIPNPRDLGISKKLQGGPVMARFSPQENVPTLGEHDIWGVWVQNVLAGKTTPQKSPAALVISKIKNNKTSVLGDPVQAYDETTHMV